MNIDKYIQKARNAIEKTYIGKCNIIEYNENKNSETKITTHVENIVCKNQPCRVSFQKIDTATEKDGANEISQIIKLFIDPAIQIKEGSKIVVTQNNITTAYQKTGVPAMYSTHQEIELKLFEGWA